MGARLVKHPAAPLKRDLHFVPTSREASARRRVIMGYDFLDDTAENPKQEVRKGAQDPLVNPKDI